MKETTVKVSGMVCGMCEAHINDAVRAAFQVKKVSSSHTKGETVILSEDSLDLNWLKKIISDTGYQVESISEKEMEKKSGLFGFLKK